MDSAPAGLIVLYPDHTIRLMTDMAIGLLGLNRELVSAGTHILQVLAWSALIEAGSSELIRAALARADAEPQEVLLTNHKPDGHQTLAVDIRAAGGLGWVLSLTDVTQTRRSQDWLLEHVSSDPVTGLWNRQHFMLMLQDSLSRAEDDGASPPAVLLVSLHRFRQVAETLGLTAGDTLLRMSSDRLTALLGEDDTLARFAGDQFAFSLGGSGGRSVIQAFCTHVQEALSRPYMLEGQIVLLGGHIGVARAPDDGCSGDELMAHASLALQASCDTLPSSLRFFDADLMKRAQQRRGLEADLRQAVGRREFELHYQPQVDVLRGGVTGLEALIRWRSPTRGLVSPIDFIPLAEEIGLICEIGDWVLREACRQASCWPDDMTVAVNASPLQFETGTYASAVADALRSTGLPPCRLEVEITENLLLRDTGEVLATLAALQRQGVRLVLDDFGTGYASLSQLSRFRFDKIKIDRSFVSPVDVSTQNSVIVRSIAALGYGLGIPITAEGVETVTQLDQIKADGCTCVQGYYFSRPVPAADVGQLLGRLHKPAPVAH